MNKMIILIGSLSFLIGVIILFYTEVVTANLLFVHGIGPESTANYISSKYAVICFIFSAVFMILLLLNILGVFEELQKKIRDLRKLNK